MLLAIQLLRIDSHRGSCENRYIQIGNVSGENSYSEETLGKKCSAVSPVEVKLYDEEQRNEKVKKKQSWR